jgi:hypothetical protein
MDFADDDLPLESSAAYTATIGMVGQVIALLGVQIARERSRPRPDRAAIREWEAQRNQAVLVCRRLSSADPAGIEQVNREYTRLFHQVLSSQARLTSRPPVLSS